MFLSKTLYPLLSTGSHRKIHPDITEKMFTGPERIKPNKQTKLMKRYKLLSYTYISIISQCRMRPVSQFYVPVTFIYTSVMSRFVAFLTFYITTQYAYFCTCH